MVSNHRKAEPYTGQFKFAKMAFQVNLKMIFSPVEHCVVVLCKCRDKKRCSFCPKDTHYGEASIYLFNMDISALCQIGCHVLSMV